MAEEKQRQWSGTTGGNAWMHRRLIQMLKYTPLNGMYWFAAIFVLPFCFLFNRKPVRAISLYFRNRHNLKGLKLHMAVWQNHYRMMQTVIDRFAVYSGKRFDFEMDGNEAFKILENSDEGFILLSSHVGNTELVGYSMGSTKKRMSALVYAGEAPTVMEYRRRLLQQHNIEMISVEDNSFNHLYAMNDALARGNILGMPADRVVGSQKVYETNFLGVQSEFPLGPFATAVQMGVKAVAIFMIKTGTRKYRLLVCPVWLTEEEKASLNRRQLMVAMGQKYVRALEHVVKEYPHQ
ncbi:MAG: lysophospholipid acyltransferase family protein, partial [Ruminococcus flavefaciens]|nr:lysophospholipid acyltransferase family protein [Ruminococcus flavefaciens]